MSLASLTERLRDRLPVVGRLRRQRDIARGETRRLAAILSETLRRDRAFIVERNGLRLLLDPASLVDRNVLGQGWESERLALMAATARSFAGDRRRRVFLDIGAHWGLYALTMHRLGVFDEIHCFEPEPASRAHLGANLFLNDAAYDVTVHPFAALDRARPVRIQRADAIASGNRGSAAIVDDPAGHPVAAVAVDDLLALEGAVVFVKLDVEGAEPRALAGMRRLIAANEVYLQVEVMPGAEAAFEGAVPDRLPLRHSLPPDRIHASFPVAGLPA